MSFILFIIIMVLIFFIIPNMNKNLKNEINNLGDKINNIEIQSYTPTVIENTNKNDTTEEERENWCNQNSEDNENLKEYCNFTSKSIPLIKSERLSNNMGRNQNNINSFRNQNLYSYYENENNTNWMAPINNRDPKYTTLKNNSGRILIRGVNNYN